MCEQVEVVPCYTESHSTAADGAAAANVAQLAMRVCGSRQYMRHLSYALAM